MVASFQTGMRGQEVRQASMVSPYVRGRAETHVRSSSISAVKTRGAGGDGGLSRMVTSRASEMDNVAPSLPHRRAISETNAFAKNLAQIRSAVADVCTKATDASALVGPPMSGSTRSHV
jgi:hypothetical protein